MSKTLTADRLRGLTPERRAELQRACERALVKYRPLPAPAAQRSNQPAPLMILGGVCP